MTIQLAPELEARIQDYARDLGLTLPELLEQIVVPHDNALSSGRAATEQERHAIIEQHIEWMKANSPGWETADPYAVDWQAFKAEGRKY